MDYWTAFILGLVGSLHCAGMCGPLALAVPGTALTPARFALGRVAYNSGRIVTYCALGMIFGLFGKTLLLAGVQRWVSISLGVILIIGVLTSRKLALWRPVSWLVNELKARMSGLLRQRSIAAVGALGLLNGLLPCGLVYVAAAGATATGQIFTGAIYMAAFGIGTLPMMLAIGLGGKLVPISFRLKVRAAIPAAVFLMGALLILRGMSLGIPYVSPNLAARSCCH